jgi:hypothetical protein
MISPEIAEQHFGPPPYYRNRESGEIEPLPHRIRLSDGSTRTDADQWRNDPAVLQDAGYELAEVTQADVDSKKPNFEGARQQALQRLNDIWGDTIRHGWQTPMGWSLGLDIADVTLLTGAFLLLKESQALGLGDSVDIIDVDGVPHTLDLPTFTQIMLAYGQHRSNLAAADAVIRSKIKSATNEGELAAAFSPEIDPNATEEE